MFHGVDVVVRTGPVVVSVVMTLTRVVDATVCLEGQGASRCLTIRCLASEILLRITDVMLSSQKKFERGKEFACQKIL